MLVLLCTLCLAARLTQPSHFSSGCTRKLVNCTDSLLSVWSRWETRPGVSAGRSRSVSDWPTAGAAPSSPTASGIRSSRSVKRCPVRRREASRYICWTNCWGGGAAWLYSFTVPKHDTDRTRTPTWHYSKSTGLVFTGRCAPSGSHVVKPSMIYLLAPSVLATTCWHWVETPPCSWIQIRASCAEIQLQTYFWTVPDVLFCWSSIQFFSNRLKMSHFSFCVRQGAATCHPEPCILSSLWGPE